MNKFVRTMVNLLVRGVTLAAGLIFLASVLVVAMILLGVWLLRAVWAKLTGQPVIPWKFQVNRQAMWNRFYCPPGSGQGAGRNAAQRRDDSDVVDVEPKVIKPPQA